MQVEGGERIYAIADEDLERENEEKTSAVHFLRFELAARRARALRRGARPDRSASTTREYRVSVEPSPEQRAALLADLA